MTLLDIVHQLPVLTPCAVRLASTAIDCRFHGAIHSALHKLAHAGTHSHHNAHGDHHKPSWLSKLVSGKLGQEMVLVVAMAGFGYVLDAGVDRLMPEKAEHAEVESAKSE
jgi:hypothetical protein